MYIYVYAATPERKKRMDARIYTYANTNASDYTYNYIYRFNHFIILFLTQRYLNK